MKNALPLLTFATGLLLGATASALAGPRTPGAGVQEEAVTAIGGVFFRAEDPDALRAWYREHLGLEVAGPSGASFLWRRHDDPEQVGRTVWSVFPESSDYFGDPGQRFMVNYVVRDLDALLAELAAKGVEEVKSSESYPFGTFAWVEDGEGNRIELWEPAQPPGG